MPTPTSDNMRLFAEIAALACQQISHTGQRRSLAVRQAEEATVDSQIDELVYALCCLTDDEIARVESCFASNGQWSRQRRVA